MSVQEIKVDKGNRNSTIDIMRTIGILLMFAAHCSLPEEVHFFREFDLVMLFFVSGMSFGLSSFEWSVENYTKYLKKRLIRLVLPAWGFMCVFFLIFNLFIPGYHFSSGMIIKSFLLTSGGIMFVWVYRVFVGTAITTPVLKEFLKNVPDKIIIFGSIAVLLGNDILHKYVFLSIPNETVSDLLTYLVSFTVGYGIITFLGLRFLSFSKKDRIIFILSYAALFLFIAIYHRFEYLENFKYPPYTYYISYGLAWSGLWYVVLSKLNLQTGTIVQWISKYCMRLYLAHIPLYYVFFEHLPNAFVQYTVLFGGSVILTLIYNWVEKAIKEKSIRV